MNAAADLLALEALEAVWGRMCDRVSSVDRKKFDQLLTAWEPYREGDPIVIETDLLSPLGRELGETSHTQALAFLLDPNGTHGLGEAALAAFLCFIDEVLTDEEHDSIQSAFAELGRAEVLLERAWTIVDDTKQTETSRTDLWIELPAGKRRILLVVEMKIDAPATDGQLSRYEQVIEERVRAIGGPVTVVKIFLTPEGFPPRAEAGGEDWRPCNMLRMASYLRRILTRSSGPGAEFLRLYLATVLQKVMRVRWSERSSRSTEDGIFEYLTIALEPDDERE